MIVVDNGSADGSAERLAAVPGVELIVNESNLGFAAGNNLAIERLLDDGARVRVGAQQRHRGRAGDAAASCSPSPTPNLRVGAVGSVIYDMAAPRPRADLGWRVASGGGPGAPATPAPQATGSTTSPPRRCCCAASALRDVGVFDTRYFFTWEDVDLCIRLRRRRLAPRGRRAARVWHRWGGTLAPLAPRRLEEHAAGLVVFMRSHSPAPWLTTLPMLGYYAVTAMRHRRLGAVDRGVAGLARARVVDGDRASSCRTGTAPIDLGPCIRSLAAQDHDDFEIVVVDNGSVDDSLAVLDELAARDRPGAAHGAAQRRQPRLRRRCQPWHPPRHRVRVRRRSPCSTTTPSPTPGGWRRWPPCSTREPDVAIATGRLLMARRTDGRQHRRLLHGVGAGVPARPRPAGRAGAAVRRRVRGERRGEPVPHRAVRRHRSVRRGVLRLLRGRRPQLPGPARRPPCVTTAPTPSPTTTRGRRAARCRGSRTTQFFRNLPLLLVKNVPARLLPSVAAAVRARVLADGGLPVPPRPGGAGARAAWRSRSASSSAVCRGGGRSSGPAASTRLRRPAELLWPGLAARACGVLAAVRAAAAAGTLTAGDA